LYLETKLQQKRSCIT